MHRFYVSYNIPDARGKTREKQFNSLGLKHKVGAVYLVDCYTIDTTLNKQQLQKTKTLLANPKIQVAATTHYPLLTTHFSYAIQISLLPGVTDNIGHTAKETLIDGARVKFKPGQNVYTSQVYFISGSISLDDAKKISDSLHNPLIQRASITSYKDFKKSGLPEYLPKVKLTGSNKVSLVDLNVADVELEKIGKLGIQDNVIARRSATDDEAILSKKKIASDALAMTRRGPLALSLAELKAIRSYFEKLNRQPTDIELETLAQTWSEHCKHTIFGDPIDEIKEGLFKHYIKRATDVIRKNKGTKDFCVSVFSDNAGGISFDENYIIAHKVETHNTPSALDPFGGAITGIVGVNRDALGFGLGAKPVANFYGFCLAEPNDKSVLYRDKDLQIPMLSARRIMDGVIAGINAGGNQSGIPTPLGFLYFDKRYRGKPLVFAGTMGLLPKKIAGKKGWVKKARPNDLIVMIGGRVGADGIHGATFSSEGLDAHSPATAVQIGDPITQKKFSDAICKEARDLGLYNSITDCGAGGLSSAVGEMAKESNGVLVNLDVVPLKYSGLAPWQTWISESQERMVLAVPKNKWQKFKKLMHSRGVEATAIGQFTNSGKCEVKFKNKHVMNLELQFLHNGRPVKHLKTSKPKLVTRNSKLNNNLSIKSELLSLLSSPNITSTDFISTQYDHEVQGSSVIKPVQGAGRVNNEASVIRPILTSKKGIVTSYGLVPNLSETNPYLMTQMSIDNAVRAAVAAGANIDYLAILDNFCWCSSNEPERLWQLKEALRAAYDTAVTYGTPFVSGKDSMFNDFKGFNSDGSAVKISIPPTLLITTFGVIPDATKALSIDAKLEGDVLYIIGNVVAPFMGLKTTKPDKSGNYMNLPKNLSIYRTFYKAAQKDLIASAISVNLGGISVALAKKLIAGNLGAEVKIKDDLFAEHASRILITVDPKKVKQFEKIFGTDVLQKIGTITKQPILKINNLKIKVSELETAYKKTFKDF